MVSIPEILRIKKSLRLEDQQSSSDTCLPGLEILEENSFLNVLRLERKRVGRTGRRFVLMLLEPGRLLADPDTRQIFNRFLYALPQSTRETDHRGWYEQASVFGIIFTDICETQCGTVIPVLTQRIGNLLSEILSQDQVNEVRLSVQLFPESSDSKNSEGTTNFFFYRDLVADLDRGHTYHLLKRALDIAMSLGGLIFLFPLFAAIALAIRVTSDGPILFRQVRIGQFHRQFTFLKFRSMYANNDQAVHRKYVESLITKAEKPSNTVNSGQPIFKLTDDPRITPFGRFLRRTSLDELPQLMNVLRGEMTLVGPRPCIPYEFDRYEFWHRERLLAVKPGLTGLWQVTGRSSVQFDEMVRLDLAYVKSRSLWLDLSILMQTPRAVISGAGAY